MLGFLIGRNIWSPVLREIHRIRIIRDILLRDAIHTHFVTLIVKWTIGGGWVKPLDDKRGKVGTIKSPKNLG